MSSALDPDLQLLRPASQVPGALRRTLLQPGERILFETRPSLAGRYWGRILLFGFFAFIFIAAAASEPWSVASASIFLGVLLLLPVAYWVTEWRNAAYAITDLRILRVDGLRGRDVIATTYDRIRGVSRTSGWYGGLRFELDLPGEKGWFASHKGASIEWDNLQQTAAVYQFVQAVYARRYPPGPAAPVAPWPAAPPTTAGTPYAYRPGPAPPLAPSPPTPRPPPMAPSQAAGTFRCPACGLPINPALLNPALPQCPRCLLILPMVRNPGAGPGTRTS